MQKDINNDGSVPMDVETKEEPTEWVGDSFTYETPQDVRSTCGLRNLGNSCYLNSVVQSLANVPPLAAFMTSRWSSLAAPGAGGPPSNVQRREFCEQLAMAMQKMWCGELRDFAPRLLTRSVIDTVPEFRMHGQQDAEEALNYALNNLHDDLFVPVAKELHPAREALEMLEKERQQLEAQAKARLAIRAKGKAGEPQQNEEKDPALKKKKEEESRISQAYEPYKKSIINDAFQSLLAQRVTCASCECTSLTVQESFNLPLELPSKSQMKTIPSSQSLEGRAPSVSKVSNLKSSSSQSSMNDPGSPKTSHSTRRESGDASNGSSAQNGGGGFWSSWSTLKGVFSLGMGHNLDLDDCLRSFFAPETLKGEEQYYCENCKSKVDATKVHEFAHLPEILCLQLKRFNKSRGTWGLGSAKNSTPVKFPVEGLDLRSYCGTVCSTAGGTDRALYDLIGVIRHSGGASSGHYIATCKSWTSGKWFEFDDEFVKVISDLEQLQSPDAYLLFYAKRPSALEEQKRHKALNALQRQASASSGQRYYLSRAWALRFETMSNPGAVENSIFQCEHGGVLPTAVADVRDRVVSVTGPALTVLEQLYGCKAPQRLSSLDVCESCQTMYEKLQGRRDSECRTIEELDNKRADVWYMVPKPWVSKWISFVKNDCGPLGRGTLQGAAPPPKMDTEVLMEKQPDGTLAVKPNLKLNIHYQAVNRAVFKYWEVAYGLQGPAIVRVKDSIYSPAANESLVDPHQPGQNVEKGPDF